MVLPTPFRGRASKQRLWSSYPCLHMDKKHPGPLILSEKQVTMEGKRKFGFTRAQEPGWYFQGACRALSHFAAPNLSTATSSWGICSSLQHDEKPGVCLLVPSTLESLGPLWHA